MSYFNKILKIFFFVMFLMFAMVAISNMVFHYMGAHPDKITVEFESSLIYSIYSASFSVIFFQLFYSLYKHKRWPRLVFGMIMSLWLVLQLLYIVTGPLNWNPNSYIYFLVFSDLVPALIGPSISDHISNNKSTI